MYQDRAAKLDEYESVLKQEYVNNDEVRSRMKESIEESANAASRMFETLMERVMQEQPVGQGLGLGSLTQAIYSP
jgi:ornithine carbamoyltransferase